ncbi:maltase-glucoamylase, intestinal protein [Trema orientale]|uniref:Maltase-glucoamylase, intestinal protein n=1 Tax=Trema orientale TaxID=63057 RepID=A0A2P5DQ60_TREOI|nr:maltase-glucoamylase, intestinal protein [Trema orientale]
MAEAEGPCPTPSPSPSPSFLEVKCKSSGETRRFAVGTEAGFAVSVINRKLGLGLGDESLPLALHIEAIKQGQEPITFGPNSVLLSYGDGWILQTVTDLDFSGIGHVEDVARPVTSRVPSVNGPDSSHIRKKVTKPAISLVYFGKIIFAFVLLFALGAIFTLALEYLPALISYAQSSI